jgi:hypothetical protein
MGSEGHVLVPEFYVEEKLEGRVTKEGQLVSYLDSAFVLLLWQGWESGERPGVS